MSKTCIAYIALVGVRTTTVGKCKSSARLVLSLNRVNPWLIVYLQAHIAIISSRQCCCSLLGRRELCGGVVTVESCIIELYLTVLVGNKHLLSGKDGNVDVYLRVVEGHVAIVKTDVTLAQTAAVVTTKIQFVNL